LLGKVIFNEFSYAARHQSSERFTKYETVSLDQIVSDRSESDYHEVIADNTYNVNNDENEFDVEYNMKQKMYLFNKIASKREKELLHKHYVENITITNIAKEWGITRQAASLLHRKCLDKIRNVGDVRISV
jgi:DNA-directed RNA polymerase specialized sigma subunit